MTDLIALITVIVLILQNAARIPAALADLLDACQQVVHAARSLAATVKPPIDAGPHNDPAQPNNRRTKPLQRYRKGSRTGDS